MIKIIYIRTLKTKNLKSLLSAEKNITKFNKTLQKCSRSRNS